MSNEARLDIAYGAVVKMAHASGIVVETGSAIVADGRIAAPVWFTSMDDNTVGETVPGSDGAPEPGGWNALVLEQNGESTTTGLFTYTGFYYGGGDGMVQCARLRPRVFDVRVPVCIGRRR